MGFPSSKPIILFTSNEWLHTLLLRRGPAARKTLVHKTHRFGDKLISDLGELSHHLVHPRIRKQWLFGNLSKTLLPSVAQFPVDTKHLEEENSLRFASKKSNSHRGGRKRAIPGAMEHNPVWAPTFIGIKDTFSGSDGATWTNHFSDSFRIADQSGTAP
jgi:hypothetical protein